MEKNILLIADIHGNFPALVAIEHFFSNIEFETIINCGDSTVYAPFPNETLKWLQRNKAISILGNTDKKVLKLLAGKTFKKPAKPEKRIMYTSTADALDKENQTYLRSFPKKSSCAIATGGENQNCTIGIFHGSPEHDHEFLFDSTDNRRFLELAANCPFDIVVCGHSHTPYHKHIGGVHFINPGSVGRMFDGDPAASCAVVSIYEKQVRVKHHRIPYDTSEVILALQNQQLPAIYEEMFLVGKKLN